MTHRVSVARPAASNTSMDPARKPDSAVQQPQTADLSRARWSFGSVNVLQRKLEVGSVADPLEREADEAADRFLRASGPAHLQAVGPGVQRKCDACKEEEERKLRRKESPGAAMQPAAAPASVHDVVRSPGRPLDPAARQDFEAGFGRGFGDVRIHTDAPAARSAHDVGALAYTVGSHVAFADGKYAPATAAGRKLLAHELAHVVQQSGGGVARRVARQTAPACNFNCTDPAYLKLSQPDREAQFNQQCPQGYPQGTTFFGQPIPAASKPKLRSKLLEAEAKAKRAMCLNGQDPSAYTLDRKIITYATHSPSQERAVDIDLQGQPYIMHEKDEGDIDKELGPVYDRIAFWALFRKSIIPKGITSVKPVTGGGTARTWDNPETGAKNEAIATGELYDELKAESDAMQKYFGLLPKSDRDLTIELDAFLAVYTGPAAQLVKLALPQNSTPADVKAFRQRIADDYRIVGGSKAQLQSFAGAPIAGASKAPKALTGDRPFAGGAVAGSTLKSGAPDPAANRRPELGFISLPREVVVALTEVGLAWGAIDFGGASGDVMHFDCRLGAC